jgi:Putative prokaryotic signal transducing protein
LSSNSDLITVFESGNQAVIAVVKSILDDAEIPYIVKGENVQNLFGLGVIGTGYNIITGPIHIQVNQEDEPAAKQLLSGIDE